MKTQKQFILDEIRKSKGILDLPSGQEGSNSLPYMRTTWERAAALLLVCTMRMRFARVEIGISSILPGHDGSIDIFWQTPQIEFMINIPENFGEPIFYSGTDLHDCSTNGVFVVDRLLDLMYHHGTATIAP